MFPSSEMTCKRSTASLFPTMSLTYFGRYFSTCINALNYPQTRPLGTDSSWRDTSRLGDWPYPRSHSNVHCR